MIDYSEIIIAGIGIVTTVISAWTSWFFTRKKYNSEVDNNLINNMKQSLDFYTKLSNDNTDRLNETLKRNEQLEAELRQLRQQVFTLMNSICYNMTCELRKRVSDNTTTVYKNTNTTTIPDSPVDLNNVYQTPENTIT